MRIPVTKMQGIGNDFVVIDTLRDSVSLSGLPALARTICDRKFGVGADGLIFVLRKEDKLEMAMLNPDGSLSEMCGNGLRCFARLAIDRGYASGTFPVVTGAGELVVTTIGISNPHEESSLLETNNVAGATPSISIDMGKATFPLGSGLIDLNDGFQATFSFNIGEFATADGQQHYSRFLFSTINDKSGADLFNLSNIRVVCRNTYAVALSNGVTQRFRHTAGIDARVAEVANPMISQRLNAAILGQQEYIAFYNDLLALPAPNADLFFETVFGKRPDEGRAKAQWETKVDGFKMALSITEEETPELVNTAAFWFNASTRSQQTRRTRQRDPLAMNGGMALAGVNSEVVDLATAFFMRAIRAATVALPSPIIA